MIVYASAQTATSVRGAKGVPMLPVAGGSRISKRIDAEKLMKATREHPSADRWMGSWRQIATGELVEQSKRASGQGRMLCVTDKRTQGGQQSDIV
jgi:hypothetical protein